MTYLQIHSHLLVIFVSGVAMGEPGGARAPPFKACGPSQKILGGKSIQNQRCGIAQKADKIMIIMI